MGHLKADRQMTTSLDFTIAQHLARCSSERSPPRCRVDADHPSRGFAAFAFAALLASLLFDCCDVDPLLEKVGELTQIVVRHGADVTDGDSSETFQSFSDCGRRILLFQFNKRTARSEWLPLLRLLGAHWERE